MELDTIEIQGHDLGKSIDDRGLGETRTPHQQGMSPCQNADQQAFNDVLLTDDDLAKFLRHGLV